MAPLPPITEDELNARYIAPCGCILEHQRVIQPCARHLEEDEQPMPRKSPLAHDEQLMKLARTVARLETKSRGLRSQLKTVTADLRYARRTLKAYAQSVATSAEPAWNERAPALRAFGER